MRPMRSDIIDRPGCVVSSSSMFIASSLNDGLCVINSRRTVKPMDLLRTNLDQTLPFVKLMKLAYQLRHTSPEASS